MKQSHVFFVILTTTILLGTNPQRLAAADWSWADATPGHVPFDAVVGGSEGGGEPLYICRANFQNGFLPGKFRPEFQGCNIDSNGREVAVHDFQVLVPSWAPASNGNVPPGAPAFGREPAGSLFVCRANVQGGLHPGKVRPGLGGCEVGFAGKKVSVPNYEVLITQRFAVDPGLPDTEALVGGHEDAGNLFICLGEINGGTYPGKFRPGFDACNIALGENEVAVKNIWRLLIPTWLPSESADPHPVLFQAGNEADGTPNYICRSQTFNANGSGTHPGKYRRDRAGCDITWAGKAFQESQHFEILAPVMHIQVH